ncbi:uncharacterized protein A1O9_02962 [Exophiala aquamarina CBS 119918]|uniref:Histone chaperone domain-containing protein n=1 Tax=Exophiala aquamarina CBS 119918 TaxID=1182545 RepID=A0A072PNE1_9EURO|nr:uncharacterized protein A1O9_02962 [Exophiala aquamarina CBS 119918]KEF61396.1 hypothetical protein A1O9_02962 [Exophiala aquamarina CBS 119918]
MSTPNDDYQPGTEGVEASHTADTTQNDYKSRTGQSHIPVVGDDSKIEDPIEANTADSDEQLARDDQDAIDQNNILGERTRGATAKQGTYREPGDEEGLGGNDGRSAVAGGPN